MANMAEGETRIIEVYRIEEMRALVDLVRYIAEASREKPLDDDEFSGLEYLLEDIQAVIG
jgi:hypothetical protein